MGGGGGVPGRAGRSARASSRVAGRAAAAAYALRVGDAATLFQMGLDLEAHRSNNDPIDVARQIVNAACESALSDSTIEDEERRYVASDVTNWVLEENAGGDPPKDLFYWSSAHAGTVIATLDGRKLGPKLGLMGPVPPPNIDFVRLATAVFAADRSTPRACGGSNWSN